MKRHRSRVSDWMTTEPFTIGPGAAVGDAYDLMVLRGVRRLPVVDAEGDLLGIITLSDILQGATPPETRIVGATMSADPVTVMPGDTIQEAAERMLEFAISGLPVVEGEHLVGIITESDIFRLIVETWAAVEAGGRR